MAFTGTALNAYTKRTYDPKFIENSFTSLSDSILQAVSKDPDGSGEQYSWLADADDSFNGSADFVIAQNGAAANNNVVGSKFLSDWNNFSAVAQLTSDVIGKTRNNDGAWQRAYDVAMRKTIKGIAHANGVLLQGYGWGEVSTIASVSGSTFVPGIRSDITKYVKGMPLHFSLTRNADLLRSTTVVYVTGVSYTKGAELVTLSATLASVSAVNGDTAFIAGCRQNSATPSRIALAGLGVWIPNQASGGADMADATVTTLLGAPRTSNSRLYGTWVDATSGGDVIQALIEATQEASTVGGAKKIEFFASKTVFGDVAKNINNNVIYDGNPANKTVGTKRLLVYSDGQCEGHLNVSKLTNDNQIWGFDPATIKLRSIGAAPHIDAEDGLQMARQAAAAGYEVRWFQQAIYEFTNPAANVRIQLV